MGKGEIKKIVLNHLVEEELLPEEELENGDKAHHKVIGVVFETMEAE